MDDLRNVNLNSYSQLRTTIKSGDILFCSGESFFSKLIQKVTNSPWSHVAFILRLDIIQRIFVLESVESIGVRAIPLSSYVKNYNASGSGYAGQLLLARHDDMHEERIKQLSTYAVDLLGYPYDTEEILRIAARISMNPLGINPKSPDSLSTKEFICSEYVYACFKSIGIKIDYDELGFIAPSDFAKCKKISAISFIKSEIKHAVNEQQIIVPEGEFA